MDGLVALTIAGTVICAAGICVAIVAMLTTPALEDWDDEAIDVFKNTASGDSPLRLRRAARATTASHHRPDSGLRDIVECEASPPPFVLSDEDSIFDFDEGSGDAVPADEPCRDRPVLFLVASK